MLIKIVFNPSLLIGNIQYWCIRYTNDWNFDDLVRRYRKWCSINRWLSIDIEMIHRFRIHGKCCIHTIGIAMQRWRIDWFNHTLWQVFQTQSELTTTIINQFMVAKDPRCRVCCVIDMTRKFHLRTCWNTSNFDIKGFTTVLIRSLGSDIQFLWGIFIHHNTLLDLQSHSIWQWFNNDVFQPCHTRVYRSGCTTVCISIYGACLYFNPHFTREAIGWLELNFIQIGNWYSNTIRTTRYDRTACIFVLEAGVSERR